MKPTPLLSLEEGLTGWLTPCTLNSNPANDGAWCICASANLSARMFLIIFTLPTKPGLVVFLFHLPWVQSVIVSFGWRCWFVSQSVGPPLLNELLWNFPQTFMVSKMMDPNDFNDSLTLLLAPPWWLTSVVCNEILPPQLLDGLPWNMLCYR